MKLALVYIALMALVTASSCPGEAGVRYGADVLLDRHLELLQGKRVGLITNQTGRLSTGELLVDALLERDIRVTVLFAPEHGLWGSEAPGALIADTVDPRTGIKVLSLHGKTRKPTPDMLQNVDLLVYDLQDVGVRCYTYISTMVLAMEAAAEAGIPFVVLDRPDPLNGLTIEGPLLPDSLRSFIGMLPIPLVYGLTCGELARMVNGEHWLSHGVAANLTVIPMEGWRRSMRWDEAGLPWVPPSPNLPSFASACVYPATCLLEATNVSEGRGTPAPFELFGAPFLDSTRLTGSLNALNLASVRFAPVSFTPSSSKYRGVRCYGASIEVLSYGSFDALRTGLDILALIHAESPGVFSVDRRSLIRLLGDPQAVDAVIGGAPVGRVLRSWDEQIAEFRALSERYYLYPS